MEGNIFESLSQGMRFQLKTHNLEKMADPKWSKNNARVGGKYFENFSQGMRFQLKTHNLETFLSHSTKKIIPIFEVCIWANGMEDQQCDGI